MEGASETRIEPQAGPQTSFLASPADIAVYGGQAGGGKTFALLLEPTRHLNNPGFGAVIFRQTYPQITQEGGMWDESGMIYSHLGGRPRQMRLEWWFPSGARIRFGHMQYENDKYKQQGSQICLLGFDQVEQFSESQFFFMLSRNRSTCGVRPYVRMTCNPDPDSWLAKFLSWWIDDETGYAIEERSGVLRWFVRPGEEIEWGDSREELLQKYEHIKGLGPKSVTFIPASVDDNKILLEKNPGYLENLMALPLVLRERLLRGNWKIREEAGNLFNRAWFRIVPTSPAGGIMCRFWDLAATKKEIKKTEPDFTAGMLCRLTRGEFYFEDCIEQHWTPGETDRWMVNTAHQDLQRAQATGARYMVRWEREGGASGKRDSARIAKLLGQFDAKPVRPAGDKVTRARPLSGAAEAGNIYLVAGLWNGRWLTHMHNQPQFSHDDIMDASSGAYNALAPGAYSWAVGMAR